MSKKDILSWYEDNISDIFNYAIQKLGEIPTYIKYGVSTDYLKLDHIGIGLSRIVLTFVLKEISS